MIENEEQARAWLASTLPEADLVAIDRLERLTQMLVTENARQNLVSEASLAEVWRRHIADSAQLLKYVPRGTIPWLDLGTGAGFPGLVIAILRPECEVVMVESRKRRIEWLDRAKLDLGLDQARVIGARLEAIADFPAAVVSARAFAQLDPLLVASARFSTTDTTWLLPKGRSAAQELVGLTGWRHTFHVEQSLTDPDAGIIVGTLLGRDHRT
ncbi:MAG: rsmG [Novosphingobium sp.]|nr:rsmG [Novosphingobium sp.]